MRVLQRNAKVSDALRRRSSCRRSTASPAGARDGRPVDWFIYVNGILTDQGAGAIDVHGGDRIWWDHHDWGVTPTSRAVVGSYPEPFVHGTAASGCRCASSAPIRARGRARPSPTSCSR